MTKLKGFVGRESELKAFHQTLQDPSGQAIIISGQPGMGKSWLLERMSEEANRRTDIRSFCIGYQLTETDGVDSIFEWMLDEAFGVKPGSFDPSEQRRKQWKAVLNVIKIGDLVDSLRRDPKQPSRQQFLDRLNVISEKLGENERLLFWIDPHKYLPAGSDQAWSIVIENLPDKIKFVFAQRPDDVLDHSECFVGLGTRLVRIPPNRLEILSDAEVDQLISEQLTGVIFDHKALRQVLDRYAGHPFAIHAAIKIISEGTAVDNLPIDPTGIPPMQWKKALTQNPQAASLLKACTILNRPATKDMLCSVANLDHNTFDTLLADTYIGSILNRKSSNYQIYHALLSDHIQDTILTPNEARPYHQRAAAIYRKHIKETISPSPLAAERLPYHVKEGEGPQAFVRCFVNECFSLLYRYGMLETIITFSDLLVLRF